MAERTESGNALGLKSKPAVSDPGTLRLQGVVVAREIKGIDRAARRGRFKNGSSSAVAWDSLVCAKGATRNEGGVGAAQDQVGARTPQ